MVMPNETVAMGAALPYPGAKPEILYNGTGYYIGYVDTDGQPYTRESRYYEDGADADRCLDECFDPEVSPGPCVRGYER